MKLGPLLPLRLAAMALIALITLGLVISAVLTLRERERLAEVENHLARMHAFDLHHLRLERTLTEGLSGAWLSVPGHRDRLIGQLEDLIALRGELHPETPERLQKLRSWIHGLSADQLRPQLVNALYLMSTIATGEHHMQETVLEDLRLKAELQLRMEVAAPILLIALGGLLLALLRRRILDPLTDFGMLLSRLSRHDYRPADSEAVDSLVRPLFENFNELAQRLEEFDRSQREHADSLASQVRSASKALLAQQRSLARSERLSATGELAASVAHELRNPLAGIQMTLGNLRDELAEPDHRERVDRVISEILRLSRQLSQLVDSAHQRPEPAREVSLHDLVEDMLVLMRYQVAAGVELLNEIDRDLRCPIPDAALRQALLNLALNGARAIDESGQPGRVRFGAELLDEGRQLKIRVSDDGPGFPDALLRDGIRPFFSTRQDSSGGLGLPMVRRFARDYAGELQLENLTPRGARVTLLLPCHAEA